ncbi:MAG: S26 family signal peptidase [Lacibacter sp.]
MGDIVAIRNIDFIDKVEKTSIFRIIAKKGDTIQFKNGIPYVNNIQFILPKTSKRFYLAQSKDLLNIEVTNFQVIYRTKDSTILNLSFDEKKKLEKRIMLKEYALDKFVENSFIKFKCCQNHDFFGPVHLPEKITNSDSVIVLHKGKWTQDLEQEELFFVIGDNVQDAIDSRYIGLVPASYVLGKLK